MVVFPTEEWVGAWVALVNSSPDFRSAGVGWVGSACLIVTNPPVPGDAPFYLRLTGQDGHWSDFRVARQPHGSGDRLTLAAPYDVWRKVIRQELGPLRGIVQGDLRVKGHLPDLLKYRASVVVMCELAGRLDTRFLDD